MQSDRWPHALQNAILSLVKNICNSSFFAPEISKNTYGLRRRKLSPTVVYNGTGIGMQQKQFFYNLHGWKRTHIAFPT